MSLTAGSRVAKASAPRGKVPQVMQVWPIFRLRGVAAWSDAVAAAASVFAKSRRFILSPCGPVAYSATGSAFSVEECYQGRGGDVKAGAIKVGGKCGLRANKVT